MMLIAITKPVFIPKEAQQIVNLLGSGFTYIHLRKPQATESELRNLIEQIPAALHSKLKLHDCFNLLEEYNLGGVHLNRRNPEYYGRQCMLSRSCHSFEEVDFELAKGCYEYVTLSPIFDSISKPGYSSNFSLEDCANHVQGKSVIALGGVTPGRLSLLEENCFMGAAMLGAAWVDDIGDVR